MDTIETPNAFFHVVYFWIKDGTSGDRVDQLISDCKTFLGSIKTVKAIQVGTPAGTPRDVVDNSYAVSIIVKFDDRAGHDHYQEVDTHEQFIERNKDIWERVQVYDMISQ